MKPGPLSVMISQSVPHQRSMSLNIQSPIVFPVSVQSEQYSGKWVSEQ